MEAYSNAGQDINTEGDELFPTFYNGSLYFSSNGHPGMGGLDIFKLERNEKGGLLIKNMGYPINSSKDDLGFSINKSSGFLAPIEMALMIFIVLILYKLI